MEKRNRYLHYKNGREIDLVWKPYTLHKLSDAGLKNDFMKMSELLEILGENRKNKQRILYLRRSGWLMAKKIKGKNRNLIYTISARGRNYLKKFRSFDNVDAPLFNRLKIPEETEEKEFIKNRIEDQEETKEQEIIKEKETPKVIIKKVVEKTKIEIRRVGDPIN